MGVKIFVSPSKSTRPMSLRAWHYLYGCMPLVHFPKSVQSVWLPLSDFRCWKSSICNIVWQPQLQFTMWTCTADGFHCDSKSQVLTVDHWMFIDKYRCWKDPYTFSIPEYVEYILQNDLTTSIWNSTLNKLKHTCIVLTACFPVGYVTSSVFPSDENENAS